MKCIVTISFLLFKFHLTLISASALDATGENATRDLTSKDQLITWLLPLKVGKSTCDDIEKILTLRGISYSIWDYGRIGDGNKRYRIRIKRPFDSTIDDIAWSHKLSANIEVENCVLKSKDVSYTYL